MKRSSTVNLVILGTLALTSGCSKQNADVDVRQNTYASKEDCLRDWGGDERNCEAAASGSQTGSTGLRGTSGSYFGPRYFWNHTGGYPVAIDRDGSTRPIPYSHMTSPHSTSSLARSTSFSSASVSHSSISRGGFGRAGSAHLSGG